MPAHVEDAQVQFAVDSGDEGEDEEFRTHALTKKDLLSSPVSPSSNADDTDGESPLQLLAPDVPATTHRTIIPAESPGSVSSDATSPIPSTGDRAASANMVILSALSPRASTSSDITHLPQSNGRIVKGLIPVGKPPPGTRVYKIINAGQVKP